MTLTTNDLEQIRDIVRDEVSLAVDKSLSDKVGPRFDAAYEIIQDLKDQMRAGFNAIHTKFEEVDRRFTIVDNTSVTLRSELKSNIADVREDIKQLSKRTTEETLLQNTEIVRLQKRIKRVEGRTRT